MIFPIIYGDKSRFCHQYSIISHQPSIEQRRSGLWRQDAQTPTTWVEIDPISEFPMWDPKKEITDPDRIIDI